MAVTRPALWEGVAWARVIRKAPEKPRPKPAPAITVPARKAAAVVVAIAPNVTATPASRSRQPASIAARELMPRSMNAAAAPVPQIRKITSPPHSRFGEPVAAAASDGPSDRYRPPSAQVATKHGTAPAKVDRAWRGTAILGRSEARTPGRLVPGSAMASTATVPAANTASSAHQIRWVGAGAYWTSALVISAPRARPRVKKLLVTSGARWLPAGCRPISAAPIAPLASPVAMPCRDLATYRAPTLCAVRKTAHPATLRTSAAMITGSRPR